MVAEIIKLKVFVNKKTRQGSVVIPKKEFGVIPKFISVVKDDVDVKKVRRLI